MTDITARPAWRALETLALQTPDLRDLFTRDPLRFQRFSIAVPGMLVDLSKNLVSDDIRDKLVALAEESNFADLRADFFDGRKVNVTEDRAALHMALRAPLHVPMAVDGEDVTQDVQKTLMDMQYFANAVRNGHWRGRSGREITDIVNIGTGGSFLGPQLVTEALSAFHHPRLACHYVANVDASDLARVLQNLSPETTLFIIASKTFTTVETMQNAAVARDWILGHYRGDDKAVAAHFVAASTNAQAVADFGIAPDNMFPFREWVGGRYSVWSSIGLSTMLMVGPENFFRLLEGAHAMDMHFQTAPLRHNIPVMLALIGLWYRNFLHYDAYAVIPYHALLRRLPAYLQQLDMESNGKSVARDGAPLTVKTGPLVFGEPGTDAQHSFFQWLHQGTDIVPVDFVAAINSGYGTARQQNMLLANLLAQSEALMLGRANAAEPHRHFDGNRPSTIILLDEISPRSIGQLLALYEHKVFVQGALWGINSFDQWGVELGKALAGTLEAELAAGRLGPHDGSTQGLLGRIMGLPAEERKSG